MLESKIKICVADDHTLVREGLVSLIGLFSEFEVIMQANDGSELLRMLNIATILPDVAILDISMPELNGYETTSMLRKLYPSIKILGLSIFNNEYSILRMLKNGANGYLHKSCTAKELKQSIIDVSTINYHYSKLATEKAFLIINSKSKISDVLTKKEIEFLYLCCDETLTYKKIAELMFISFNTAQDYHKNIGNKLGLHTRTGLAVFAIHSGIYPIKNLQ